MRLKNSHMRILASIYVLISLTSCNAQQQNEFNSKVIDTAKLFDPSGENDGIAKIMEAKNAVILQKNFYDILLGGKEYPVIGKEKLAKFLTDSSNAITRKKFYIIIDSSKTFRM